MLFFGAQCKDGVEQPMPLTPVQKELSRIAADYQKYFVLKGLSVCWLGAAGAGILLFLLYWFAGLNMTVALPVLAMLSLIAGSIVFWRRSRADLAIREIARQIENDDPRLNSLLLAAMEQNPDPRTGELSFLQLRVIREAIEANRKSPWGQKFAERLFFAQTMHFGAVGVLILVFSALAFTVPPPTAPSFARSHVTITPGNAEIEKGSAVAIVAQLPRAASTGVTLIYSSPEGGEKRVAMARSLNDPLYGFTLPSVDEATRYRVEYDGALSDEFNLKVFEHPELKRADAELTHPAYTGLGVTKIEDTRRVSAVEGTGVHYTFHLNKPVRSARLVGTNDTALVLTNDAPKGLAMAMTFELQESGRFRLELIDEEGRTNKLPTDFVFVALRNEPPKLKLQMPRGDQRVSALQEVQFEGEAQDDFGVSAYGIAYSVPGKKTDEVKLVTAEAGVSKPHEKRAFNWNLAVETLGAEAGELISYYLWAEDLGPDGQPRRSQSDMYFAEVRPFEEIFRASNSDSSSSSQQQQQQQNNPATKLLELQKEIVTATWNIQRREKPGKVGPKFAGDVTVVKDSQEEALDQARELAQKLEDEKSKALGEQVVKSMTAASKNLAEAADEKSVKTLPTALEAGQAATQALLKLQAREFQVSRSRNSGGGGGQGNNRNQQQLDQLEFTEEENRYEQQSQAAPMQSAEQREALQVLNRLKELARRQQDMSERLKELQTALNEAKSEKERQELDRQLKRLQEEQQQIVQDMDEVRQRMAQPENQSRMSESRQQLDQTRQQSREAARSLENRELSQALSSSSRAQEQLEKLSDDFRKSTSNQFSEEMRQMRQQARELDEKQQQVAQKLGEMKETRQRTLSEEGPRQQAAEALAQQRSALTNLLQNMRSVTEQAEAAEPLLSKQLYETLRKSSQASPEKNLELASQLLDRNFLPQAAEAQEKAGETIRDLREGVERAANSVLGDEAESLRFAQRELQDLAQRAERELQQANGGANSTNGVAGAPGQFDPNATNRMAGSSSGPGGTNRMTLAQLSQNGEPSGGNRPGGAEERQPGGDGQQGEGQESSQQQAQQAGGQQPGQQGQQQGQGQAGNQNGQGQGEQAGQAQTGGRGQNQSGERPQQGNQRGGGRGGGGNQAGPGNFFDQWAGGDGRNTAGGGFEGPLTGNDYTRWSDRLRDIEEVLQDPGMRADVSRVREQARSMRMEFKRHAEAPQWGLFESEVIKPLRILQNRVADELARHASREAVVPVDRDPVPPKYADAVSRYYERLGKD